MSLVRTSNFKSSSSYCVHNMTLQYLNNKVVIFKPVESRDSKDNSLRFYKWWPPMSSGRVCSCCLDCMLAWMESYYPKLAGSLTRYIYVWLWKTILVGWSELLKSTKMDLSFLRLFTSVVVSICKEKNFDKFCRLLNKIPNQNNSNSSKKNRIRYTYL